MPKIVCVSYWMDNYRPLADLTMANRQEFARRHGHAAHLEELAAPASGDWKTDMRKASFSKFGVLLRAIDANPDADWVWYADCDGMVMDMRFDLEAYARGAQWVFGDLAKVYNCCDCNGPNGGSMLVRICGQAREFLRAAAALESDSLVLYDNEAMSDVSALRALHEYVILPQRPLNCYDYLFYPGQGKAPYDWLGLPGDVGDGEGALFLHWPGRTLEQRIAHYHKWEGKVRR